ncbi:hypothetical protein ID852_09585 [Xenorhabdus sp. 42]|uniref:hypothetical protein n=1 Tax=Xenorhabdus szentirmaii TaxID=290112 RepID=UPI00199DE527|nr:MULTISPECIES: hypothetical protein [unclassified Xenorhabdus]MBD2793956.1 hypothetical protein [Xenorhabdus sp. CUL]MBD2820940.1 hypothetical protein [Xenorhabdus sp. 42]MBD2826455.1 hypothetical protein [Xenorhabdus sp. 5]
MQLDENITIAQLKILALGDRNTSDFLAHYLCNSYEDFLKILYKDLDECIKFMEEDPKVRRDDTEDRLTTDIIHHFRVKGYQATHDEMIGGHVDIAIRYRNYMWLGEAKIHSSYSYLMQGFNQLCTRYSSGDNHNCNGGLIIYIRNQDAASVIREWNDRLNESGLPEYISSECNVRKGLSFYTEHKHNRSGLPYRVRHMAVILGFDPQDRK